MIRYLIDLNANIEGAPIKFLLSNFAAFHHKKALSCISSLPFPFKSNKQILTKSKNEAIPISATIFLGCGDNHAGKGG